MLEKDIREFVFDVVTKHINEFCDRFEAKHVQEFDNPKGTINSKVHNNFIGEIDGDLSFYSALVRSLDSSLGNAIEGMALELASVHFDVSKQVEGFLYEAQTTDIAVLLQSYSSHLKKPSLSDYEFLREDQVGEVKAKRHASDYLFKSKKDGDMYLIELKLGGDLDNKKSRSEKEALLEQYAILSNSTPRETSIQCKFATAYNKFGEGNEWRQSQVRQFFAEEELLIASDFWNFCLMNDKGHVWLLEAYKTVTPKIRRMLRRLKELYVE